MYHCIMIDGVKKGTQEPIRKGTAFCIGSWPGLLSFPAPCDRYVRGESIYCGGNTVSY